MVLVDLRDYVNLWGMGYEPLETKPFVGSVWRVVNPVYSNWYSRTTCVREPHSLTRGMRTIPLRWFHRQSQSVEDAEVTSIIIAKSAPTDEELHDFLVKTRDAAKTLFGMLGYIPDSWERTSAMGRTEEAMAFIDRLIEKAK